MSSSSVSTENVPRPTFKTKMLAMDDQTDSERLVIGEEAKEYLVRKFRNSGYFKSVILEFENHLVAKLEEKSKNWIIQYHFANALHRLIFRNLCEYYGFGYFLRKNPTKLILFCSRHQSLKKSILELAREDKDNKVPIISSTSETGIQNLSISPTHPCKVYNLESTNPEKGFNEDTQLSSAITERENGTKILRDAEMNDDGFDSPTIDIWDEVSGLFSSSSEK
ncbi:hypothetical protein RF11_05276 [Thelohanellus kitauei]|uniref:Uncharacterized protein n=1 Tax=Thelohanellus kitauei TaxID=669202 RepID=A0A0C2MP75_THEKT|nr:hypothetical protein RF11_05276 [Thelohanellus kitauei]